MLRGLDPLLNAEILYALRAMGHGDDLVMVDANFPADSVARVTALGELLRIDNASLPRVAEAILPLYPIDEFVDDALARMEVVGDPEAVPPVLREVQQVIDGLAVKPGQPMIALERHAFYERAKQAYCIIQTGERRFYGNLAVRKGVIAPDA